jgi:microcystin-dependent protein
MLLPVQSEIVLFPYDFVPRDWLECNGEWRKISEETLLFSLLRTRFGGSNPYTFKVPYYKERAPQGLRYCMVAKGTYPMPNLERRASAVGEVAIFAFDQELEEEGNWVPCDGRLLPVAEYPALAALLGNKFGGDGKKDFGVPHVDTKEREGGALANDPLEDARYFIAVRGEAAPVDPYIGEVRLLAASSPPAKWVRCDGKVWPQAGDNHVLSALLGTRFGGDGKQTFGVPDLRSHDPQGLHHYIAVEGMYPTRP